MNFDDLHHATKKMVAAQFDVSKDGTCAYPRQLLRMSIEEAVAACRRERGRLKAKRWREKKSET